MINISTTPALNTIGNLFSAPHPQPATTVKTVTVDLSATDAIDYVIVMVDGKQVGIVSAKGK